MTNPVAKGLEKVEGEEGSEVQLLSKENFKRCVGEVVIVNVDVVGVPQEVVERTIQSRAYLQSPRVGNDRVAKRWGNDGVEQCCLRFVN